MESTEVQRGLSSKIFGFIILYTLQGLPYGLQSKFLPLYFRTHGMSLSFIGMYKILLIPWVVKFLWAPAVDNMAENKHTWVKRSLLAMSILCLLSSRISPNDSISLSVILFLMNTVTSIKDIAVDALLIESSTHSQLVMGNTIQVVGFKAGSLITGGLYMWYIDTLTWNEIFCSLSFLYVVGYFICLFIIHPPEYQIGISPSPSSEFENEPNIGLFLTMKRKAQRYFRRIIETRGTRWMLKYMLFYKLGR